jgi:RNA polymerase sigma factor (sigma-70 family)
LSAPTPLALAFQEHRDQLLRFLRARGAGDTAEDLLQEVWIKVSSAKPGPIASPKAYLFSTANRLMIDHYRSARQAARRERNWAQASGGAVTDQSDAPSAERVVLGQEYARLAQRTLDELGPRPAAIFRRHRVDEVPQRKIAEEFGVSLSTVESDLRRAYRALTELKERMDEV